MSRIGNLFRRFRHPAEASRIQRSDAADTTRWVVAGLGNPGPAYNRSRHNLGFMVVERLALSSSTALSRRRFKGVYGEGELEGAAVILVQPQTFYNASGETLAAVLKYFRVPPEQLIVVHDDLDLEVGRLRVKRGGGDAGNKGVRSVAAALGTPDFVRVRVGIGRPVGEKEVPDYLLEQLKEGDLQAFGEAISLAADAVKSIMSEGLERAMNRFNQRT